MGCADNFVNAGMKVTYMSITAGDKTVGRIDLSHVPTEYNYALMIPQCDTERLMTQHLNSLGVTVERSLEMSGFTDSADGIRATLKHADGKEEVVEASWLVGCDGAHSTTRHALGKQFVGDTMTSDWVLADVQLSGVPHPGEVSVLWHAEGVLVLFPITQTRYRMIADVGAASSGQLRPDPTLEEIQSILDRRGPGTIKAHDPIWLAAFRINERKVTDYRGGHAFLAGDAAHIHSPAGGQGMNTGMQDACNLAWKLALVVKGKAAESLLQSYSPERSAVGEAVLKNAGRLTTLAIMRGGVQQAIRNHLATLVFGLPVVQHNMAESMTELSIGYPESPLTVDQTAFRGEPKPGQRAPIRAGEIPVGSGSQPRFVLFGITDIEADRLIQKYPDLLEMEIRAPFEKGGLWLVRPDGYVSVATTQDDWKTVADFLEKVAK
jgi:2-polyprenyl-6-methoxyphenol hydroxylase-like FAD-dependent oxidoreductase